MNTQNPTRQLLLEQGLVLCREKGLRGIKVRELAAAAGVNLGSFVYHFGNRERFLDELVELWYTPCLPPSPTPPRPRSIRAPLPDCRRCWNTLSPWWPRTPP